VFEKQGREYGLYDNRAGGEIRHQLSLSRLNHGQPGVQAHPEIVQGTAELHHQIADALLPQADPVFHNATTLGCGFFATTQSWRKINKLKRAPLEKGPLRG